MAVTPQFQNFMSALPKRQGTGFNYSNASPYIVPGTQPTFGQVFSQKLNNRASTAQQNYSTQQSQRNVGLASDVLQKSTGTIPLDQFFKPQQSLTDFSGTYNQQLQSTKDIGTSAMQAAEARNAWMNAKKSQDLPAGAAPNNPGAKAVALAMNVVKNNTPYVWGGNSLKNGVDCSGLVQQIYKQLGISLPRVSFDQARSGKVVNRNNLLPGDLVFYNTGRGNNTHVAIYMGNGKVIEAPHTGANVRISNLDSPGQYSLAIQPW
jgi:cell wall-associated NlpC family hydrolase